MQGPNRDFSSLPKTAKQDCQNHGQRVPLRSQLVGSEEERKFESGKNRGKLESDISSAGSIGSWF